MISGGWLRGCYPPQGPLIAQAPAESSPQTSDVLRAAQSLSLPQVSCQFHQISFR